MSSDKTANTKFVRFCFGAFFLCGFFVGGVPEAMARGGSSIDDCAPGIYDPDCTSVTVLLSHAHFEVEDILIHKESTVVISNKDPFTHNVQITNEQGDVKDLGLQNPGQDVSTRFSQSGKYKAMCALTPTAKMVINVK